MKGINEIKFTSLRKNGNSLTLIIDVFIIARIIFLMQIIKNTYNIFLIIC